MGEIRVVHLISRLNVGGAELALYRLLRRSDRSRLRHIVVSLIEPGPVAGLIAEQGIPVYSPGMQRGRPSNAGLARTVGLLRRELPHILQSSLYHARLLGAIAA